MVQGTTGANWRIRSTGGSRYFLLRRAWDYFLLVYVELRRRYFPCQRFWTIYCELGLHGVRNLFGRHLEHGYHRRRQRDQSHERLTRSRGARGPYPTIRNFAVKIEEVERWHGQKDSR